MKTLQEQFEERYPDNNVKKIDALYLKEHITLNPIDDKDKNHDLDLRKYKNLEVLLLRDVKITTINLSENENLTDLCLMSDELTSIELSKQKNLRKLDLRGNCLTSVDFLNQLSSPEKLEELLISYNKIQPTDIEIFSKFVNLKELDIGGVLDKPKKLNKFCGSFKSWKNLTKLESINIEATDINEGLEYLPKSLATSTAEGEKNSQKGPWYKGGYYKIKCSSCDTNAKCEVIQDQLKLFDYDLEAWQLAANQKVLISR